MDNEDNKEGKNNYVHIVVCFFLLFAIAFSFMFFYNNPLRQEKINKKISMKVYEKDVNKYKVMMEDIDLKYIRFSGIKKKEIKTFYEDIDLCIKNVISTFDSFKEIFDQGNFEKINDNVTTYIHHDLHDEILSICFSIRYPTQIGKETEIEVFNYDINNEKRISNTELLSMCQINKQEFIDLLYTKFAEGAYVLSSEDIVTHQVLEDDYYSNKEKYTSMISKALNNYNMYIVNEKIKLEYNLMDIFKTYNSTYAIGGPYGYRTIQIDIPNDEIKSVDDEPEVNIQITKTQKEDLTIKEPAYNSITNTNNDNEDMYEDLNVNTNINEDTNLDTNRYEEYNDLESNIINETMDELLNVDSIIEENANENVNTNTNALPSVEDENGLLQNND